MVDRIDGPLRAELFVVWLEDGDIRTVGEDGCAEWFIALDPALEPQQPVRQVLEDQIWEPIVLHSTSWRHADTGVVLTFLAVVDGIPDVDSVVVTPAPPGARAASAGSPRRIEAADVLQHALRHLAWLADEDAEIGENLPTGWIRALAPYRPEPFRNFSRSLGPSTTPTSASDARFVGSSAPG